MKYLISVLGLMNVAMAALLWVNAGTSADRLASMKKSRDDWRNMTIEAIEAAKECQVLAGWRK